MTSGTQSVSRLSYYHSHHKGTHGQMFGLLSKKHFLLPRQDTGAVHIVYSPASSCPLLIFQFVMLKYSCMDTNSQSFGGWGGWKTMNVGNIEWICVTCGGLSTLFFCEVHIWLLLWALWRLTCSLMNTGNGKPLGTQRHCSFNCVCITDLSHQQITTV